MLRDIIRIDPEKCDGCGQCVSACPEGALQIVEGKARLVKESYCDGLGACLGECPRGAITIEQRQAEAFDPAAVHEHLQQPAEAPPRPAGGCPGSAARRLERPRDPPGEAGGQPRPELAHWPVQLRLVPPTAPYLQHADLLVCADCVPFALGDFHQRLLRGRAVLVGCPKLDDAQAQVEKLAAVFALNAVRSVTVAHMEVPCCGGIVSIVEAALAKAGRTDLEVRDVTVGVRGTVEEECPEAAPAEPGRRASA
ncbi:MAG: hypothetical protein AMJ81_11135 [Phycisphaerae bacterium SM23_33]|nr:MAG: hypothetical protein AMJ81_11135 [Phycisphaerae bacterium SM23_33]